MLQSRIRRGGFFLAALVIAMAGCGRGPDLESPQVQQAWLRANEQKIIEALEGQGYRLERTGQSQVQVAKYSRRGKGVCVIFVDGENDPPQVVSAAYLLPTSEDGSSWRIAAYVSAAGSGGTMNTVVFEKSMTEEAPDVAFELDMYLSGRGITREKLPGEGLF
ncbi:hypothetical protein ACFL5A_05010 [Gemmatimonadota bacterium]